MTRKKLHSFVGRNRLAIIILLAAFCIACFAFARSVYAEYAWEDVAFDLHPSAQLAYTYGEKHFDAQNANEYDIDRANYFFGQALILDPTMPLVHHELARIAFLRNELQSALTLIDQEIEINPHPSPSSYYMRALIKGYMGDYAGAAQDYETYFTMGPASWGGINDYSWVSLKAGKPQQALTALQWGLKIWPTNPWLLNSEATAYFELGDLPNAKIAALKAQDSVAHLTVAAWLSAYPGNDPLIAPQGIAQFQQAVGANLTKIEAAQNDK